MCGPALPVAMFALQAGQAVMQYRAQQQQAAAQTAQHNQNAANSLAAARSEQRQLAVRAMQEEEAYATERHIALVDQAQAAATVTTQAASSGVAGISVDNLVADVRRKSGFNLASMETQWENTAAQLQEEMDATNVRAQGRINSTSPGTSPSPLGAIVSIAGAGLNLHNNLTKEEVK